MISWNPLFRWTLERLQPPFRLVAWAVLPNSVQLFVVGRVQLLIANSQVTRPETRTFGYYALGLLVPGLFLGLHFPSSSP
jgi:hypothetical protein